MMSFCSDVGCSDIKPANVANPTFCNRQMGIANLPSGYVKIAIENGHL